MKYRNLRELTRDHPARNTPLRIIKAEWKNDEMKNFAPVDKWKHCTFNELTGEHQTQLEWRSPEPE